MRNPSWREFTEKMVKLRPSQRVKYARVTMLSIEDTGEST